MEYPENFERDREEKKEGEGILDVPPVTLSGNTDFPPIQPLFGEREKQEGSVPPPASETWYGISYKGAVTQSANARKKGIRAKRVALVAGVLAFCILLSGGAGFFGAWLAKSTAVGGAGLLNGGTPQASGSGNGAGSDTIIDYVEGDYDFPAALAGIVKSSDESLVGSPNGSAGNNKKSLIQVTNEVKDSVVEITTTITSNRYGTMTAGAGSGVIIHADGIVVTNNHVIENCDNIYVRLTNGDTYEAVLRGTDEDGDIALLKITPQADKPLTVAKLGYSKALALGEEVIAIGNPLGQLGGTVTNGIISALERDVSVDDKVMTLLQTNAAINSGNSGGGLFNMAGELIGVVNAKYSASGVEGLGFAIPIDRAYEKSFKDLLNYGYIKGIASLGLTLVDYSNNSIFNVQYAACVHDVGTQTDFQVGDYIYSINGTVVYGIGSSAVSAVNSIVKKLKVGDTVTVEVVRNNQRVTLPSVILQEYRPSV